METPDNAEENPEEELTGETEPAEKGKDEKSKKSDSDEDTEADQAGSEVEPTAQKPEEPQLSQAEVTAEAEVEEPLEDNGTEIEAAEMVEPEQEIEKDVPVEQVPAKVKEKTKPSKSTTSEDEDDSSLGLGPSEYIQPQFEKPKVAEPKEEKELSPLTVEEEEFGTTIFAIKTAIGHEKMVAERIVGRGRKRKLKVFSVLSPTKLRGYVLLECINNRDAVKDLIKGLEHVRNVVDGETTLDEIEHFLTPKPLVFGIMEGDIVEIIQGPFKGEKAKVQQIDESKEEITVELFEAMVSIPVTIRGDHVRVLEKEGA